MGPKITIVVPATLSVRWPIGRGNGPRTHSTSSLGRHPPFARLMDPRAVPFANLLQLNAGLVANCLEGLSEDQARARVVPSLNSMAFLLAHLTDARHALLRMLGGTADNPLAPYLTTARSIEDVVELPPLSRLLDAWWAIDAAVDSRLKELSSAEFDEPSGQRYPGGDSTVLGAVAFLVQHDSYHLGQLALLRRAHALPAMRYGRALRPGT